MKDAVLVAMVAMTLTFPAAAQTREFAEAGFVNIAGGLSATDANAQWRADRRQD